MNSLPPDVMKALAALQQACADAGTPLTKILMRNTSPGLIVFTPCGSVRVGLDMSAPDPGLDRPARLDR